MMTTEERGQIRGDSIRPPTTHWLKQYKQSCNFESSSFVVCCVTLCMNRPLVDAIPVCCSAPSFPTRGCFSLSVTVSFFA